MLPGFLKISRSDKIKDRFGIDEVTFKPEPVGNQSKPQSYKLAQEKDRHRFDCSISHVYGSLPEVEI